LKTEPGGGTGTAVFFHARPNAVPVIVAPTDVLKVTKATWSKSALLLAVAAASTNPQAIITVLNASGNVPLGTMANQGGGSYTFQMTVPSIASVNIRSNLGGATGQGVTIQP